MIDWKRVETLQAEIGEADLDDVVDLFLEEVEEVLDRLRHPALPRQREADLHFLKGSALNLGFSNLAAACQRDEARAARGEDVDPNPIISLYSASKQAFQAGRANPARRRA
ncbi:MAG: Hpt domain-containing protein [Paracoccaceae bacterium]|nr:Hpt domain-containing protein [Paracoccaceae bacterium]MDE3123831.1 Hpt domain-containing protein [Paracoccaceae bacterium]MDE3240743.1 Hpt domain-containing protein [Paracoccaceae bacterium]